MTKLRDVCTRRFKMKVMEPIDLHATCPVKEMCRFYQCYPRTINYWLNVFAKTGKIEPKFYNISIII